MSLTTQSYDITLKVRVTVPANAEILAEQTPEGLQGWATEGANILSDLLVDYLGELYGAFDADLEVTEATGVPVDGE